MGVFLLELLTGQRVGVGLGAFFAPERAIFRFAFRGKGYYFSRGISRSGAHFSREMRIFRVFRVFWCFIPFVL